MNRPPHASRQASFRAESLDHLRAEAQRMDLDLPTTADLSPLGMPLDLGSARLPNRFCALPMEGGDGTPEGAPGPLTFRRYARYAHGGFGLIWFEATAVAPDGRSGPRQLWLKEDTVDAFAHLVRTTRRAAVDRFGREPLLLLQLAHAGRYSKPDGALRPVVAHHGRGAGTACGIDASHPLATDDYLDSLQDKYVQTARLAEQAGFDGIDVKSCHGDLVSELSTAFTRQGKYGGSFDNRTRFLRETLTRIARELPGLMTTTRLGIDDAHDPEDEPRLEEAIRLVTLLRRMELPILGVTVGPDQADPCFGVAPELQHVAPAPPMDHPLREFHRRIAITRRIQQAFEERPVVGCGYSWLRDCMPSVAAGLIREGAVAVVGLGRGALAYPDTPADILESGRMDPARACLLCSACSRLLRDGGTAGCVIHDGAIYGPEYRHQRRFAMDHLRDEAHRCHDCRPALCTQACPAHIDVPAFVKAFEVDDTALAFKVIRQSNVLPEMCAHLCPTWMQCEGACVESTLTGCPIPIHDIQYAVSWLARQEGLTAVRLDRPPSGKHIAVVGGGPAGLAGTIRLLERGHRVTLFEQADRLGGVPERVIPHDRFSGMQAEIDTILRPALEAGHLDLQLGRPLGPGLTLDSLKRRHDAVLLSPGLWQDHSLGSADGVVGALSFLEAVSGGRCRSMPAKTAVLSGGDSAMDAAVTARKLGATDVYVVYAGARADMHWHLSEDWFKTEGAHCLTLTRPLGYQTDESGRLTGLRIARTEPGPPGSSGPHHLELVPGTESVLQVDAVIEAMGLGPTESLRTALHGVPFSEDGLVARESAESFRSGPEGVFSAGALVNGGASVAQCVAEGMAAAAEIDRLLSA